MKGFFFVLAVLFVVQLSQAGTLYRWVDKDGKVHYGDTPVEDAEKLKFSSPEIDAAASGVDDASLPYEARQARQHFPVTLYVTEKCGDICKQAGDFLRKRKVPFDETMLKTEGEVESLRKKSGSEGIPVLSVGRTWLNGFQSKQWQDELDAAGYPK